MRYIGARELKNRTGEVLDLVAEGETVYVTRHGRTLARIEPESGTSEDPGSRALGRRLQALRGKHRDLPGSDAYAREKAAESRRRER